MEIEDFKIFSEVSKSKSISKAALYLHLTQPTVSKKIKRLENEIGFKLFERNNTGIKLTKSGLIFLEYTNNALAQIEKGIERGRTASNERVLKIASPSSFSQSVFSKIIPFLEEQDLIYEFYHYHSRDIPQLINNEIIDIGILERESIQNNIISECLHRDPIVLCCSKKHKFSNKEWINLYDINNEKLALFSWGKDFELLLNQLSKYNISQNNFRRISPVSVVKELILENNYIAFLPYTTVQKEVNSGHIRVVNVRDIKKWFYNLSIMYKPNLLNREDAKETLYTIKSIRWL